MRPLRLLLLGALACAHGEPFDPGMPAPQGPLTDAVPRRLTFNTGDDRSPAIAGSEVTYSRYDPGRGTSARCLAVLPAEGGTLRATWCPPAPSAADTFVSTWLEPALADAGDLVAFLWQRGAAVSSLAAWSHHLVVAAADAPATPTVQTLLGGSLSADRRYNTAYELTWVTPARVRFLAAYDSIPKVKGGGSERFTDTLLVPRGLMELEVATGAIALVPGGDSVTAYTAAPDGGLWVVKEAAPAMVNRLEAGSLVEVASVGGSITDLAVVDGRGVVATGTDDIGWFDPVSGARGVVVAPGPVRRLTGSAGRRFVAEVEADAREFGAPANLWLFELPPRAAR